MEEEIFASLDDLSVLCCIYVALLSLGVVSTMVADTPHKIFVGCLPNYLNEDEVGRASSQKMCRNHESVFIIAEKFIYVLMANFSFIAPCHSVH